MLIAYVKSFSIKVWWEGADFFPCVVLKLGGGVGNSLEEMKFLLFKYKVSKCYFSSFFTNPRP